MNVDRYYYIIWQIIIDTYDRLKLYDKYFIILLCSITGGINRYRGALFLKLLNAFCRLGI